MPELPEVETIARALAPRLRGRRILQARFFSPLIVAGRPKDIRTRIEGRTIRGLRRRGKFLLIEFDDGPALTIHLGMTGALLWDGTPGPHTRALFTLDGGRLVYDDIRQFGRIASGAGRLARLGPEPLDISAAELAALLARRRGRIKPLLLDQRFLAGLGNIYADEILFRAGIHPRAVAARLSAARVRRLHKAMREVLQAAIADRGSSISDYVDADGRQGSYQLKHRVYRKTGQPCPVCQAKIKRVVVAGRGTHYCPRCQPLTA
ncbi:MAG: bifunctional DNA-formamidopyrimidine glycosylase/DNA-(apurinic or apyrimidinic site) lyase [Acidobacteriota bacterium]